MAEGIALDNDLYYSLFNPDASTATEDGADECTGGVTGKSIAYKFCLPYGDKSCFDYSNQGDDTHILNANILVALSLLEVSKEENSIKCNELIMSSYNYILEYLKNYADLPYAGKEDKYINKFWKSYDCYHTGFVLRSMYKINKELNENKDFNVVEANLNIKPLHMVTDLL